MRVVLISTYELGHQPFGLASPVTWLQEAGADVQCLDLAVEQPNSTLLAGAALIAFYVPMHTATRMVARFIPQVRAQYPQVHICCYGLYAPMNAEYLQRLGANSIIGGEFEEELVALYRRLEDGTGAEQADMHPAPVISLAKQQFKVPNRRGLPDLSRYAWLQVGDERRVVGYTEATRGCRHMCRHCPIVPVYGGRFRIVDRTTVLADIRQQVAAGARHITFGDPDFFNGPGHAIPLVEALHEEFPELSYDVTIKVEHLLKHARYLPMLRDTGCAFVTSAVESIDATTLAAFDKRHTRADFFQAVEMLRELGLHLNPTFVTWTPWTTLANYRELLATIDELDLIDQVAPIQYAIRLLIPRGSKLLELPDVRAIIGDFDEAALSYPWKHPDRDVDRLYDQVMRIVSMGQRRKQERRTIFEDIWRLVEAAVVDSVGARARPTGRTNLLADEPIPFLSEPWYC